MVEGKIIEFTKKLYEVEDYATIPFDIGMKGRIQNTEVKEDKHGNTLLVLDIDMSEFIKENSALMRPNWEDRAGQLILRWSQTKYYPTNGVARIVVFKGKKPYKIVK